MSDRPPYRELRLTTPFMKGELVRLVQEALRSGLLVDGELGPATASAVRLWEMEVGAPKVDGILRPRELQYLLGDRPVPDGWTRRARGRAKRVDGRGAGRAVRERAVARMEQWAADGLKERPAGSNVVPEIGAFSKSLGLSAWWQAMGWPWCCHAGMLPALEAGGLTASEGYAGRFNVLYTVDILNKASANQFGMRLVGRSQAARGDIGLVNFPGGDPRVDHFVRLRDAPGPSVVQTVEGNTSPARAGSQDNGGAMALRERPVEIFRAFIRDT